MNLDKMSDKYIKTGSLQNFKPQESSFSLFLLNSLREGRDKVALVDGLTGKYLTYRDILQKSINVAVCLRRNLGLGRGSVICISSENRFEFLCTNFAMFFIGGVVSTLNPSYSKDEIINALSMSRPEYIFCSPQTVKKIKAITDNIDYVKDIVLYGQDAIVKGIMYESFLLKNEDVTSFLPSDVDPIKDHIAILCSSGTTGLPKGVMLTHDNYLHAAGHIRCSLESTNQFKGNTNIFCILPWYHGYGFATSAIFVGLRYKYIYLEKFEEESFLKVIQDQKVTLSLVVPPMALFLAKHPSVEKYDLSTLKELWCGAAPLSKELQDEVIRRIKLDRIKQAYGLTETTFAVVYDWTGNRTGSVGSMAPGMKGKVIDSNTGEILGPYNTGELCFKGGLVMKGYAKDQSSTRTTIDEDGWVHTGDVGYYDDDDYFYVIDRVKELIKYKGYQVPPAELEALLLQHRDVKDAAVIGIPEAGAGELPLAFVIKVPNSTVTEKQLQDFVSENISPAKWLRGGVRFVEEIPKNPSGKILRRHLRDKIRLEMQSRL